MREIAIFLPFFFPVAGSDLTYLILYKLLKKQSVKTKEAIGLYSPEEVLNEVAKLQKAGLVTVNNLGYLKLLL